MIKFSEGQYYYNDIRVRSANTAMDISAKHCKNMNTLYRSKEVQR